MSDIPSGMMTNGRASDPIFDDNENLFRRVKPEHVELQRIELDAIPLPDMSVNREKYGPPEWLLIEHAGWGVVEFRAGDIPPELVQDGVTKYTFRPEHRPTKRNYPHSEVRAYRNGVHIDMKNASMLSPDAHQRWRQKLLWKCKVAIPPGSANSH